MPYNAKIAERVESCLKTEPGISQRKMFGGVCFLLHGNMLCGVAEDDLMVRVGKDQYEILLKHKYAREMDFTGKALKGFLFVSADGIKSKASLEKWIGHCFEFVRTLPKKPKK